MRWFFFIMIAGLFSCNSENADDAAQRKIASIQPVKKDTTIYIDSFPAEELFEFNTGYFKNLGPAQIDNPNDNNSPLIKFIENNLDKKEIILLNKYGLTHSCRISADTIFRTDTFRYGKTSIIQKANVSDRALLSLKIDGYPIKFFNVGKENMQEPLRLIPSSFRDFLFKKKEYYYLSANLLNSFATSIGNICYHLIYDVKNHRLNIFTSCRFEELLFGDVDADDKLDFIDFSDEGMCTTVPTGTYFTMHLYSDEGNGSFVMQKDKKGKAYFIDGDCGSDLSLDDSLNIQEKYWPVGLKGH